MRRQGGIVFSGMTEQGDGVIPKPEGSIGQVRRLGAEDIPQDFARPVLRRI
jgi:hypothetical protein